MYEYSAKILRVVDGDTLDLMISLGLDIHVKERVRLLDVNTPEKFGVSKDSDEYRAGIESSKWLVRQIAVRWSDESKSAVADKGEHEKALSAFVETGAVFAMPPEVRIRTHKDSKGKYGRYLAEVFVGDDTESINTKLILMGFGAEY